MSPNNPANPRQKSGTNIWMIWGPRYCRYLVACSSDYLWCPCWTAAYFSRLRFPVGQNQFAGFICYLLALIADKMNLTVKWCIIKGGGSRSGLVNGPFNRIWNWIILLDFNPIQRMDFLELIWRCNSEDNHCLGITKIMMDVFQGTGIWN